MINSAIRQVVEADIVRLTQRDDWTRLGRRAINEGRVALCVMAGGAATRLRATIPKALTEIVPGRRFIDFALDDVRRLGIPLWIMTSSITHEHMRQALDGSMPPVRLFKQFESPRYTESGQLARTAAGYVSMAPGGHGDLPEALDVSGILQHFIDHGGEHIIVKNIDNITQLDECALGQHIASGRDMSIELVDRIIDDAGGVPVNVDGRTIIAESFEVSSAFIERAAFHNTNVITLRARPLRNARFPWTMHKVHKVVDGQRVIQHERLIHETAKWLETNFVVVPRERFIAVKTEADLEHVRRMLSGN